MKKLQYKEIKQTFIDFLKDHDAYTRFVVYLCHPNNKDWCIANLGLVNRTFSAYVSSLWNVNAGRHYGMELLIVSAFLWSDTSEGGTYWLHLSDEWRKVVYDKYKASGLLIV